MEDLDPVCMIQDFFKLYPKSKIDRSMQKIAAV